MSIISIPKTVKKIPLIYRSLVLFIRELVSLIPQEGHISASVYWSLVPHCGQNMGIVC
jgi:hypothetical protein